MGLFRGADPGIFQAEIVLSAGRFLPPDRNRPGDFYVRESDAVTNIFVNIVFILKNNSIFVFGNDPDAFFPNCGRRPVIRMRFWIGQVLFQIDR